MDDKEYRRVLKKTGEMKAILDRNIHDSSLYEDRKDIVLKPIKPGQHPYELNLNVQISRNQVASNTENIRSKFFVIEGGKKEEEAECQNSKTC